jgi:histidine triad (HIT) family protein
MRMTYDPRNVFARILAGELPRLAVYEDELTLAFMDIMPQSDGHLLIVPKEGATMIFDLSERSAVACIKTTRRAAIAVKTGMQTNHVVIAQLNGTLAGQTVAHVHFHVIPRFEGVPLKEHARTREDPAILERFARLITAAWPVN